MTAFLIFPLPTVFCLLTCDQISQNQKHPEFDGRQFRKVKIKAGAAVLTDLTDFFRTPVRLFQNLLERGNQLYIRLPTCP